MLVGIIEHSALIISILFLSMGMYSLYRIHSTHGSSVIHHSLKFISIGLLIVGSGFAFWYYFVVFKQELPTFPISDALFVIAPFFLIHGLYHIHEIFFEYTKPIHFITKLFGFVIAVLVLVLFSNANFILSISITTIIQGYFLITNMIMIFISLFIFFRAGGHMARSISFILSSFILFAIADVLVIIKTIQDPFYTSGISDVMYIIGAGVLAVGMYFALKKFAQHTPKEQD